MSAPPENIPTESLYLLSGTFSSRNDVPTLSLSRGPPPLSSPGLLCLLVGLLLLPAELLGLVLLSVVVVTVLLSSAGSLSAVLERKDDDYITTNPQSANQEDDANNNDDDDDGNDSDDQTSTLTPTSTSNSHESTDWCLTTPDNSPTEDFENTPVNPADLNAALKTMIRNLARFNRDHPCPPPARRSTRQSMFRGSFNYNAKRRSKIQDTEGQSKGGKE